MEEEEEGMCLPAASTRESGQAEEEDEALPFGASRSLLRAGDAIIIQSPSRGPRPLDRFHCSTVPSYGDYDIRG